MREEQRIAALEQQIGRLKAQRDCEHQQEVVLTSHPPIYACACGRHRQQVYCDNCGQCRWHVSWHYD